MDRAVNLLYRVSLVAVFSFMLLPMLVVVMASLSPTNRIDIFPDSVSLQWFGEVFTSRWLDPLEFSLRLAFLTSIFATLLGLMGSFAVAYFRCPANSTVMSFLLSPLSAPQIVVGIALLQAFAMISIHVGLGITTLLLGHVLVMVPFTTRMITNSIYGFDRNLQRAASVLGANRRQTLWYIILPILKPGMFAALTFSFILSFNNIPISLFLSQPGARTISIAVINYLEYRIDPALAAVNVACLVIIVILVAVLEKIGKFSHTLYRKD